MKNKEVKEHLQKAYKEFSAPELDTSLISKLERARVNQEIIEIKEKQRKFKWIIPSLSGAIACITLILVTVFTLPGQSSIYSSPSSVTNSNKLPLTKAKSVIGNEIMLASILTDNEQTSTLKMARMPQNEYNDNVYLIHDYLITGEMLLDKQDINMEIYYNDNQDYSYTYKMIIDYFDSFNNNSHYIFYYNENPLEEDDDSDHDEISISFNGIIIIDDLEYQVVGQRENEENEEFSIETTLSLNNQKIVTIKQETEINENEYDYIYYRNNLPYREVRQEIETENNRKEMQIEIKENNFERTFNFEYLTNHQIRCEYEYEDEETETEIEIELLITEYDTYYLYSSSNYDDVRIEK